MTQTRKVQLTISRTKGAIEPRCDDRGYYEEEVLLKKGAVLECAPSQTGELRRESGGPS